MAKEKCSNGNEHVVTARLDVTNKVTERKFGLPV